MNKISAKMIPAVYENHPADSRVKDMGEVCSTVTSRWGTGGGNAPMVTQPTDIQEVVGALDTECGGNKMSHQTIASGHLLPIKSFYESSLAQYREDNVSGTIKASGGVAGGGSETFLAQPIPIHDQATRHAGKNGEKTMGKGNGLGIGQPGDPMNTLTKGDNHAVAYNIAPGKGALKDDIHVTDAHISKTIDASGSNPAMHQGGAAIVSPTLTASNDPSRSPQSTEVTNQVAAIHSVSMAVRRLTPIECERLQGFPDNYSNIPWRGKAESPDGPRYKALGNSWAVPVVAWLGQRIKDQLQ
jgi:DNA (cytosine-5)-methyltransferase 1